MDLVDVPDGYGMLLYIDRTGTGRIRLVKDAHKEDIHEHLHVPFCLDGLRELSGGGSGVTIVRGQDEKFGDVVIKHGGYKDTTELFALAIITEELRLRSKDLGAKSEAEAMDMRTSDFKYIFVSQDHLREVVKDQVKRKDSRRSISVAPGSSLQSSMAFNQSSSEPSTDPRSSRSLSELRSSSAATSKRTMEVKARNAAEIRADSTLGAKQKIGRRATFQSSHLGESPEQLIESLKSLVSPKSPVSAKASDDEEPGSPTAAENHDSHHDKLRRSVTAALQVKRNRRDITICNDIGWMDIVESLEQSEANLVDVQSDRLSIQMHETDLSGLEEENGNCEAQCSREGAGYKYFQQLVKELTQAQQDNGWKFSLAQKSIGTSTSITASAMLGKGLLKGDVLRTLIGKFLIVIQSLRKLTRPDETKMVAKVRSEVKQLRRKRDELHTCDISKFADAFVGFAIKKNFDPAGRFRKLRGMGLLFDSGCFVLPPETEEYPGRMLGTLLQKDAQSEYVFRDGPTGPTAFERYSHTWFDLLELAISCKGGTSVECIWTCGLTDAGLHNLFLDNDEIWLFDLGEPSLQPLPAFLTKFLMSFFHALGMIDAEGGGWINNFEPCRAEGDDDEIEDEPGELNTRLRLTDEARASLEQARRAFHETLKHFVFDLFDGDRVVCELLVRYTILQLLSDAAFCLDKWEVKGGGVDRSKIKLGHKRLEKWLWRTLWDLYVASYVASFDWCAEVGCPEPKSWSRVLGESCCGMCGVFGAANDTKRKS